MNKKYIHILVSMLTVVMIALTSACGSSHRDDDDDDDDDKDKKEDTRSGKHRDDDDDDERTRVRYSDRAGEKMYDKYQDGNLTESDYSTMIDWIDDAMQDAFDRMAEVIRESSSAREFQREMEDEQNCWERDWPNINEIEKILRKSSESDMGSSNYRRYEKFRRNLNDTQKELKDKAERKFGGDAF